MSKDMDNTKITIKYCNGQKEVYYVRDYDVKNGCLNLYQNIMETNSVPLDIIKELNVRLLPYGAARRKMNRLETNKLITDSKMTENEAIKVIGNIIPIRKRGRKRGFYNFDCELGKALLLAILSLKKVQRYQVIGTVEEVEEFEKCIDILNKAERDEIKEIIDEWLLYRKIGSVRDCHKAMEKQRAKAPDIWGDGTDENGHIIYDMYNCPNCGKSYEIDYDDYKYCPECGQKIERTNLE